MYVERLITPRIQRAAELFPSVCLIGARQVGKSTLLQHIWEQRADIVVFDPLVDIENARQDPDLFLNNHPRRPLILDEIQYAPELVSALKRRIDQHRQPGQFILSGSQQWSVMKNLAESLAGRVVFQSLEGFSLAEIIGHPNPHNWLADWLTDSQTFVQREYRSGLRSTVWEQLWRGVLPDAQFLPLDAIPDFYNSYLRTYIDRDVRSLSDVSDLHLFGRFVRLASALTAQEINYSQLGRDIGVTPQTSKRWLDMLQATFQWMEVPAYSGNAVKRVSRKSKGYLADTGLVCTSQQISTPNAIAGHPLQGSLFETAVVAEVRKLGMALSTPPTMYHWRTAGGAEVDLILERDGILFPIEIKTKSQPARKDTRGITAFRNTYPHLKIAPGLVIAPTDRLRQISDNDFALPWDPVLETQVKE